MSKTAEAIVGTVVVVVVIFVVLLAGYAATRKEPCEQTSTIIQIGPDSKDRAQCTDERHWIRVVPEEHWSYARVICVCK